MFLVEYIYHYYIPYVYILGIFLQYSFSKFTKIGIVKGQGHTKVKNVYNMLSHGDTPICQNLVCLCQRAKDNLVGLNFMV